MSIAAPGIDDAAARRRIRESLDETLIVEAAAGTGKTSELVRRIVALLASGRTTVDRIVAVTFTRKAAGELKLRLRQELDRARGEATRLPEIDCLEHALAHLEEASIGTIHSFCADILRERPVEARVDPAFEELSDPEARRIYAQAFRSWLEERLGAGSSALGRVFSRLVAAPGWDDRPPAERLRAAGSEVIEWRDFDAPWERPFFPVEPAVDALIARVLALAEISARRANASDELFQSLHPVRNLATWVRRAEQVAPRDYTSLEGLLVRLCQDLAKNRRKGRGRFADGVLREDVVNTRDQLLADLRDFEQRSGADLSAALRAEMAGLVGRYEDRKARAGKLDFVDLLARTRDLLRGDASVRAYLQQRFSHIFVDEFQDTDPLQAEILVLLSSNDPAASDWTAVSPAPGKLFVVGDPKQSIYRFRRADVLLYQRVKEALVAKGAGVVRLSRSFRAIPPIQTVVNTAFRPGMTGDAVTGQPEYVPLEPYRAADLRQPAVIALSIPRPYGGTRVTKGAVNECLPETVVAFIEWLVKESGWQVTDSEHPDTAAPISERHIAVLFRRFVNGGTDMTHAYVRALEARGIPHLLLGARSFHQREEVETLRAALTAIEWPDDELSVFAALKGSLFAIPDETLLRYRHEHRSLHPFRPAPENPDPEFAPLLEALRMLAEMHRARNRRPPAATLNALLEATRAHAGFALRPGGGQVLANVHRLCDLARAFEMGGGVSFRGFVDELTAHAEGEEDRAEAPVLETGAEGVRIMTVHTAKGLEFPVVILADITANIAARDSNRFIDPAANLCALSLCGCVPWEVRRNSDDEHARDEAEGVRVAYVAATRARDLLVVPAIGDEPMEGWVSPLNAAVYPAPGRLRKAEPAPGCPLFGDESVLQTPPRPLNPEESVRPGLHRFEGYEVVWWDPKRLRLGVHGDFGLRQNEILMEDATAAVEGERRYEEWLERRAAAIGRGARPEFDLFIATEAAADPPEPVEVGLERAPRIEGRPSGPRFGTLVHGILRDAAFDRPEALRETARLRARVLGAPDHELEAAIEAASAALRHPLVERARKASERRREWPIVLAIGDGRMIEGIIDLAFFEDGAWQVVDFKTDVELSLARYRKQLAWYVYAVSRIARKPARGWLLSV